jgi:hypothetical protein
MRDNYNIDKIYHCDNFEWYEDELKLKTKLKNAPFEIPKFSFSEYFYGMYINIDVLKLKDKVLYSIPLTHNCALYDMMYVEHDKKTLTMFQISKKLGYAHQFKMQTIEKTLSKMNVIKSGYTVNLVYVNDWNFHTATGFIIILKIIIINIIIVIFIIIIFIIVTVIENDYYNTKIRNKI